MSEQYNDLHKEFIKYLLRHRGLYAVLIEIELVHITEGKEGRIYLRHTNPFHIQIKGYVFLYKQ